MQKISMLDFRRHSNTVIAKLKRGESLHLTYRGKNLAVITPAEKTIRVFEDDPIYSLYELAESGESLSNKEIDHIVYGV